MKVAIYPGSFNPWHDGHKEVVTKALQVFDKVIIAQGINPDKPSPTNIPSINTYGTFGSKVQVAKYSGLLAQFIKDHPNLQIQAIVRGLRNSQDFEVEKVQQYWNEDLGVVVPTFYVVSSRELVHVSSSAIKQVEKFK